MAQYSELPVYKAMNDLLLAIFQFTKAFSKEYKYTVGKSLKKETIELITLIYRANSRTDKVETHCKQRWEFKNPVSTRSKAEKKSTSARPGRLYKTNGPMVGGEKNKPAQELHTGNMPFVPLVLHK